MENVGQDLAAELTETDKIEGQFTVIRRGKKNISC